VCDRSIACWWKHSALELGDHSAARMAPVARQFLLASQIRCIFESRRMFREFANTKKLAPSTRAMHLVAEIQARGGMRNYVANGEDPGGELSREAFLCYGNFAQVQSGHHDEFENFGLSYFLNGGVAGVQGLQRGTQDLDASHPRFDVGKLLGPEHLLHCVRALNRRSRLLEEISQADEHSLNRVGQTLEALSQRLEIAAPGFSSLLGWHPPGGHWWVPPCLENPWAEKLAAICWVTAGIARLAANGRTTVAKGLAMTTHIMGGSNPTERTVQNRFCILLSFAPELFTFYLAMFELLFPANPDD
jgi:hypothetical protein